MKFLIIQKYVVLFYCLFLVFLCYSLQDLLNFYLSFHPPKSKFYIFYFNDMIEVISLIGTFMCHDQQLHQFISIYCHILSFPPFTQKELSVLPPKATRSTSFIYAYFHSFICIYVSLTNIYCISSVCPVTSSIVPGTTTLKNVSAFIVFFEGLKRQQIKQKLCQMLIENQNIKFQSFSSFEFFFFY